MVKPKDPSASGGPIKSVPSAGRRASVTEPRLCPLCNGSSMDLLWRQSFRALDGIGLLEGYDVVACQACGMTFADHIPPQSAFDEYYRKLSKYAYEHRGGKESEVDEWRLSRVANELGPLLPDHGIRILEIGCATGRLLKFLKDSGYANVFGLDPSPACAKAASALYGVTVFTGSLFPVPASDLPYDLTILLGVLEHVRDVAVAVRGLNRLLSATGRVYVEVPDATNLIAAQDAPFQEFSPEHINFFAPTTLRYLMEGAGFRALECRSAVRRDGNGKLFPSVCGLFERSDLPRRPLSRDGQAEVGLRRYIDQCRRMDAELKLKIDQAIIVNSNVIVWGVGAHTQRLLATGALNPANVVAFVDSNPKYQKQRLAGIPVVPPEALKNCPEPILISSYGFQEEIENQIRRMKLPNKLILLYASSAVTEAKV